MALRLALVLVLVCWVLGAADQQFANLGDLRLENGAVIKDCHIGYRTYGELDTAKSNVVLWPTWFGGTTESFESMIGAEGLLDSSRHYVITVDAIGNGVSCSPSNSATQKDADFPEFTIRDMVNSQHRLLTEKLGIDRLHAVVGISMGGMQSFEWIVAYADFTERSVPIVGTTRQTAIDLMLWGAQLGVIEAAIKTGGDMREAMRTVGLIHSFALETPPYRVRETPRDEFEEEVMKQVEDYAGRNAFDWASQLRAMMALDIAKGFGGSMEKAAEAVKADVLVVIATEDHMVNPAPAEEFAGLLGAQVLKLTGDCGHRATGCESAKMYPAVREFLDR